MKTKQFQLSLTSLNTKHVFRCALCDGHQTPEDITPQFICESVGEYSPICSSCYEKITTDKKNFAQILKARAVELRKQAEYYDKISKYNILMPSENELKNTKDWYLEHEHKTKYEWKGLSLVLKEKFEDDIPF